jgi:hypothetical protein
MEIIPILLWTCVGGVIGGVIGERRGRRGEGVVLGILLGPLGWLLVLCGKDERRTCAFCAEAIKDAAKFCSHCGRGQPPPAPPKPTTPKPPQAPASRGWTVIGIAAVIATLVVFGYAVAFMANQGEQTVGSTANIPVSKSVDYDDRTEQEKAEAHKRIWDEIERQQRLQGNN